MACKRCDELLGAYRLSVSLFRESVFNFPPAAGKDFRTTSQQADRLRVKCKEDSDALMAHLRQDHRCLTQKARAS
jgi:hypothetical protein